MVEVEEAVGAVTVEEEIPMIKKNGKTMNVTSVASKAIQYHSARAPRRTPRMTMR